MYPNTSEVGTASLGYRKVFALLESHDLISCEKVFSGKGRAGAPPRTLENRRTLGEFDCVAFSIAFENDFPHLVGALFSSGINPLREKRSPDSPLIIAGGPLVLINPEPLAPIVDILFIGEGEKLLPLFLDTIEASGGGEGWKRSILEALSGKDGFYVPVDGEEPSQTMVTRVVASESDLDCVEEAANRFSYPDSHFRDVHLLEVGRGCPRRCRFCAAKTVYAPSRFRSLDSVEKELGCVRPGLRGVGFLGASLSDYPSLPGVVTRAGQSGFTVQTSSLRMDRLGTELLRSLRDHGVRTITTAPEAGTDRLRSVLGKDLDETGILEAAKRIGELNFPHLKLYFMLGIPCETWDDLTGMADLILRIAGTVRKTGSRTRITACLSPLVPKPWTAFQWAPFEHPSVLRKKIHLVRSLVRGKVSFKLESVNSSAHQALLARGDRKVGRAVALSAVEGKPLSQALAAAGISKDRYLYRERQKDELFPWDFIDHGKDITKEKLWEEWENARREASG